MRGLIATIVLLIVAPAIAAEPADSDLKSLYEARRWTELYEALPGKGAELYRAVVVAVFNDDRRAEKLLQSVIAAAPTSDAAYQAYEWL